MSVDVMKIVTEERQKAFEKAQNALFRFQWQGCRSDLEDAVSWSKREDALDNLLCILKGTHPLCNPVEVIIDEFT